MKHDHRKGRITHSAYAALVRSPLFRQRVEKQKKGKGSYSRKGKQKNKLGKWQKVWLEVSFFIYRVSSA